MIVAHYGLQRALYEGVNMSFLTQLNRPSYPLMAELIKTHLAKKGYDIRVEWGGLAPHKAQVWLSNVIPVK